MITTTQDAWVQSFIEEPAITVVVLDLVNFTTSFFLLKHNCKGSLDSSIALIVAVPSDHYDSPVGSDVNDHKL